MSSSPAGKLLMMRKRQEERSGDIGSGKHKAPGDPCAAQVKDGRANVRPVLPAQQARGQYLSSYAPILRPSGRTRDVIIFRNASQQVQWFTGSSAAL